MLFRRPSRRPRKIGESKAQYDRRVGKRPPRTVGRPTTTGRLRVPPKQATAKPVTKPKVVTTTVKKPPTQKVRAKVDPDRRQPIRKKPTVDPKKPPRPRVTKPKTKKSFQDLLKELAKNQPKRPKRPTTPRPKRPTVPEGPVPSGYKSVKWQDAGFKPPPKGSTTTSAFERFFNPRTKQVVVVPSGGYTPPKGFIRSGSLGGPVDRRPRLPVTKGPDAPTIRTPRPPANNVEKFLAGRKPNELNRQDKIRFTKELYKFNKQRQQRNINQARQQIMERFKNDPAKLQFEIARLDRNVRMGDAVEKFRAGMIGVDALKKLGISARNIDQLMFDRKMFLTPDSPAKLDTILKRRLFQANRNYRDLYKRMITQGASRGDILRMQRQFRESMRRMRQNFARQKAELEQKNILRNTRGSENVGLPRSPRAFASIFGPR